MKKYGFFFAVAFLVFLSNQSNAQELSASDPEMLRRQIANALRAGNIELALKGFEPNSRRENLIRALDRPLLNRLAHHIERAELYKQTYNIRFYRYTWTDEKGENTIKFVMAKDDQGKWIIVSM